MEGLIEYVQVKFSGDFLHYLLVCFRLAMFKEPYIKLMSVCVVLGHFLLICFLFQQFSLKISE